MKEYRQRCPLAKTLDVLGERWNLLVVRELTLGPRRYTDLLDGLPGISTNLLAARLNDLQAAGILTKRTLPPPTVVTVYELTEAGQALGPALAELRRWGTRYGPPPSDADAVRPAWALMSAVSHPATAPHGRTCELRVGPEVFGLTTDQARLTVRGGPGERPDAVITTDAETLYALMTGRISAHDAGRQTTIDGDHNVARAFLEALSGTLTVTSRSPNTLPGAGKHR